MLTRDLAEMIVRETMSRLHRNINMMDVTGRIIASGDSRRLGERHEGALEAIRSGKPLLIDRNNQVLWKGSQCGMNVPIVFRQEIVGAIGITGEPEEVAEFGEIVKMTTELMLNQIILTSRQEWRNRAKEFILEELVKPQPEFAKIDDRLQMLQLRVKPPFYAVIVETEQEMAPNDPLLPAINELLEATALAALLNAHKVFILLYGLTGEKAEQRRVLLGDTLRQGGIRARIGYSLPAQARSDIPVAFREAEHALLFRSTDVSVASYAGVEPQSIVLQSDIDSKRRFADRMLADLSGQLIHTLQVFFDSGLSIKAAAKALYVHRNTLIYRLKRVKELTGCDPQLFGDAVALQTAVWIAVEHGIDKQQPPE